MSEISTKVLLDRLQWRYAVKRFDASRQLDESTWQALEQALVLTPSSYGLQPWKFLVITDQEVKDKLPAISWNQQQPRDCSHMVVLAARRIMDTEFIDRYMQSVVEARDLKPGAMDGYRNTLVGLVGGMEDHLDWNARQVYIALGQLMVAAALVGVDTCPMEGIDPAAYDELLGLQDSEFTCVVGCAVGYRHPEDGQAHAAKVRYPAQELVQRI